MVLVLKISAFEVVAGISLKSDEKTCDRTLMC